MSEHYLHFLSAVIPFLGIWWLLVRKNPITLTAISGSILTITLVSLLAFPLHYAHASHFQSTSHECCLPSPAAITPVFETPFIPQPVLTHYQLLSPVYFQPLIYHFNTRAPPLS